MEATIEVPLTPSLINTTQGVAAPANTLVNDLLGALVSHISKAVIEQIQPQLQQPKGVDLDQLHELIESYMSRRYDHFLDKHIEQWMNNNFNIRDYCDDIDVDDQIDQWMSENFDISNYEGDLEIDDKVREAVSDLDVENMIDNKMERHIRDYLDNNLEDAVQQGLNNMTFEVRVS